MPNFNRFHVNFYLKATCNRYTILESDYFRLDVFSAILFSLPIVEDGIEIAIEKKE